jgi:L-threonylcarbamoyladenylate synthase
MTKVLPAIDPRWLQEALAVLEGQGLVAFPTDTVYGVGARVFDGVAVARIYEVKGRPEDKSIAVLMASEGELGSLAADVPDGVRRLAAAYWPGPLTIIVRRRLEIPSEVSAVDTIGVRVPDHPIALALLRAAGPLATSSANPSGAPNSTTADQVAKALGDRIELVIDGGVAPGGSPSTVADCSGPEPRILREGPISGDEITAAWGGR